MADLIAGRSDLSRRLIRIRLLAARSRPSFASDFALSE